MKVAIGNDHTAVELKNHIKAHLEARGYETVNVGVDSSESCHYPIYGKRVADLVASGKCDLGVLICGSGVGISLAANKVKGIRAVVCSEPYSAKMARTHNNANIVAFGARLVGPAMAEEIVDAFFDASFEGGRHQGRVDMLTAIENGEDIE